MSFVLVENPGKVSPDLLTVVGASTARRKDEMIGQFGSGAKFSLALLLRNHIDVRIYIGKDGYEFGVDEREALDAAGRTVAIREVVMRQVAGSSRRTRPMGFDVGFGEVDWHDVGMAMREFISNALDACTTQGMPASEVRVELVEDNQVRAKEGVTRVYIQATPPIRAYLKDLHKHFLVFDAKFDKKVAILPKAEPGGDVRIYRKGVLVGEFDSPSLFDYNLNDIPLKETRVIGHSDAREACAKALKRAPAPFIAEYMKALVEGRGCWETTEIDDYYLQGKSWEDGYEQVVEEWTEAAGQVLGERQVACTTDHEVEMVRKKGYEPVLVNPEQGRVLASFQTRVAADVLNSVERKGRETFILSLDQEERCIKIWRRLEDLGVTNGLEAPPFEGFRDVMDANTNTLGYYDFERGVVGISKDVIDADFLLTKVVIEECGHFVTKSGDCTRDLQDWMCRVAALLMENS